MFNIFFSITLCNCLGTEDINWCSFASEISGVYETSQRSPLSDSPLHDVHTFSIGDRSGLQAGQSSTRTLCPRSYALVTHAE